ncbi:MAG: 50S ribosomal protein L21 [Lentisphaeria bacterium]|nr:50S ribosomal protein L21 [Lentisphaeria bacterium]NQZ69732.1 50S ribosomal protein L21 [Lentisphaeria bacterium]
MYAVIETGGKQYKVKAGDRLEIEKLEGDAGSTLTFDRVLAVSKDDKVEFGSPTVDGATVTAEVIEQKRGKKLVVFKMKRRQGYRLRKGHRQSLTHVLIKEINS